MDNLELLKELKQKVTTEIAKAIIQEMIDKYHTTAYVDIKKEIEIKIQKIKEKFYEIENKMIKEELCG